MKNKRKSVRTNHKGPIRVWVQNSEIIFAIDMMKGKNKATISSRIMANYYIPQNKKPMFQILTQKEEEDVESKRN